MKINRFGPGPCSDTVVKMVADGLGTGQTKRNKEEKKKEKRKQTDAANFWAATERTLQSTLHRPDHGPRVRARKRIFSFLTN